MDALDAITLLKRRARMLNPITAPAVDRSMQALFAPYRPPPAIPPPPVVPAAAMPAPFVFDGVPMESVEEIRQRAKTDAEDVLSKARDAPLAPPVAPPPELQQGRRDAKFVRDVASFHARQDGEADEGVNRRKRTEMLTREERLDRVRQRSN